MEDFKYKDVEGNRNSSTLNLVKDSRPSGREIGAAERLKTE